MADNPIAQAIANQLNMVLPRTAREMAQRIHSAEQLARDLGTAGLVRPVIKIQQEVRATGIATRITGEQTLGGVVYLGVGCAVELMVAGSLVEHQGRDSVVNLGACDLLASEQRLLWHRYRCMLELLCRQLDQASPPRLILVDLPLLLSVGDVPVGAEDEDLRAEFEALSKEAEAFWAERLPHLYPIHSDGPVVVSLQRRSLAALLHAIRKKGPDATPDQLSAIAIRLVQERWTELKRSGSSRILDRMLGPGQRSTGFDYRAVGIDSRCQPKMLAQRGLTGLYLRCTPRSEVWQVELAGGASDWSTEALDWVGGLLEAVTVFDRPDTLPLPLWQAKELLQVPREYLTYFRQAVLSEARRLDAAGDTFGKGGPDDGK